MHRSLHKMLLPLIAAAAVTLGLIAPASAATPRVVAADPVVVPTDFDVLSIGCRGFTSSDGDQRAGCRWSQTVEARAYQLWRIVDRGHRELVGTYDNTTNVARDDVPDDAVLVRYAVIALDSDGEIVGRSRPTRVRFRGHSRG